MSTNIPISAFLGDMNFDDTVNINDIVVMASAYGSKPGDINWNPRADIAPPSSIINIYDLATAVYNYGETYP